MLQMFQALIATIKLIMLYQQHCHVSKYETPMLHLHVAPPTFHKLAIMKQTYWSMIDHNFGTLQRVSWQERELKPIDHLPTINL
jgi:hypothetical protein